MHHTTVNAHPVYHSYKHQMIQLIVAFTSVLQQMYIGHVDAGKEYSL